MGKMYEILPGREHYVRYVLFFVIDYENFVSQFTCTKVY